MTVPASCDVIIAGAGMAGATLALSLAKGGLRPLLERFGTHPGFRAAVTAALGRLIAVGAKQAVLG